MPLKKASLEANEIAIYDEALVYQRGEYWQMRMWLAKEKKYARFSLRTRNRDTAIDKAKKYYHELMAQQLAGKTYFSMTTKQGVEEYIKQRTKDKFNGVLAFAKLQSLSDGKVREIQSMSSTMFYVDGNLCNELQVKSKQHNDLFQP